MPLFSSLRPIKPWRWLLLALLLAGLALAGAAAAQDATPVPVTDDEVNAVAKQLYCPVCENVPLDVCPEAACIQWRASIREKLEAGWTEQEILDDFARQYGERVLARPSTRGLNLLVWLLPPLAMLAGVWAVWRFLRGAARPQAPSAAPPPVPERDEYVERLERELKDSL